MYEESKKAREAMKTKAKRLVAGDPREKVDSSTWSPPEAELADVKTGARPLVKRLYKKGGKVVGKSEGKEANKHGGRMPRKSGGKTTHKAPWIDDLINRDVRMANDEREGEKHDGAFKKGGKAKKFGGGPIGSNPVGQQNEMMGKAAGMRKRGGRAKYASKGSVPMNYEDEVAPNVPFKSTQGGNTEASRYGAARKQAEQDADFATKKMNDYANPFEINTDSSDAMAARYTAERSLANRKAAAQQQGYGDYKKGGKIKHQHIDKADELADKDLIKSMVKSNALQHKKHGGEVHHSSCTCHKCSGGRTMKYAGGGVFSGNSKEKIPGAEGGRKARYLGGPLMNNPMGGAMGTGAPPMGMQAAAQPAPVMGAGMGMGNYPMPRKAGGRTKGKTQVNIVIGAHPAQPAGNAPNMPVMPPRPPMGVPVPPPSMAGGAPMMPPGGPQMPPPGMMPRKSGGRTNYPIDSGAGGANARLEKIDAYGLKPPRKK